MAERWKYRRGVRKAQFFKLAKAKRLPCGTELSSEVPTGSELRLLEVLEAVTDTNCHLHAIEEVLKSDRILHHLQTIEELLQKERRNA